MRAFQVFVLAAAIATAGCDDGFGVVRAPVIESTFTLYSAARPDLLRMPSAIDFIRLVIRPIENQHASADGWDLALTESEGAFQLAPPGAFPGLEDMKAGIATITGTSFAAVERAPSVAEDYVETELVALHPDHVYVVRSRRRDGCSVHAKIHPIELDADIGRVRFEYLLNSNCGDRSLVPDEDDD